MKSKTKKRPVRRAVRKPAVRRVSFRITDLGVPATNNKPTAFVEAPAEAPAPVEIALKVYPHVLHVHVNGEEDPAQRVMNPNAATVQAARELYESSGSKVTVEKLDATGRPAL